MAASDQITKLLTVLPSAFCSAVYYLMLAFEALGWQDLMNEFQLCLGGIVWVAPDSHGIGRSEDVQLWPFMAVYES